MGNLIHFRQFYQSIKNRGRTLYSSPFNRSTLVLASFRLCGAPFAAAFFSKEPIIEWSIYTNSSLGFYLAILVRVFITIWYSSRLIKVVILNYRGMHPNLTLDESDTFLRKGIMILCIPSFIRGVTLRRLLIILPKRFNYTRIVKFVIFSSFVLFFIIFFIEGYILKLKGSVYFYSM